MSGFFRRVCDWLLRLFWYASQQQQLPLLPSPYCPFRLTSHLAACDVIRTDVLSGTRRATEMDITMIGLQNAGKTSLLRVLAVSAAPFKYKSELKRKRKRKTKKKQI